MRTQRSQSDFPLDPASSRRSLYCLWLICTLCFAGSTSLAEEQASTNPASASTKSFPAVYFAESLPQTSWDMITRLPGFTFSAGDEDVRGYSGASGNVLIDGQRPASKYLDLENVLRRIPARTVKRIELIRGSAPGIDMQGQSVVANIIRLNTATTQMRLDAGAYVVDQLGLLASGQIEIARSWEDKRLEGSVQFSSTQDDDDSGYGFLRQTSVDGIPLMDASTTQEKIETAYQASIAYQQDLLGGSLRLNANYWSESENYQEEIENSFPVTYLSQIEEQKNTNRVELGSNYEKTFASGLQLNLVVIQQLESQDQRDFETNPQDFASFLQKNDAGETILRATVQQAYSDITRFEWGAELAFNFLDSHTESFENGNAIVIPGSDVRVEEKRAEPFFRVSWDLNPYWVLEAGGAFELSEINQSGDSQSGQSLTYLKPLVLLTWTPSTRDQYRFKLDRQVGQLDFEDFVSSAEFSTGTINAGNSNLVPSTSWNVTATWEHQFVAETTTVLTLHHAQIADVVDVAPIYATDPDSGIIEVFDGPGNIGPGWLNEAELGVNLRLSRWGIDGGLIKASLIYRDSSVTDPITHQTRSISDYVQPWEGNIEWFHDIPNHHFRWGANLRLGEQSRSYRLDETRTASERAWLGVFAEYNPSDRWSIRLEAQNLTARQVRLKHSIYDGSRDSGEIERFKVQSIKTYPYLYLQLSWSLGS